MVKLHVSYLERAAWSGLLGWLMLMDLVLGPTSVPSTRDRSSTSACGVDRGEEKGGSIVEILGEAISSHSSGSIALRNLISSFASFHMLLSKAASRSWVAYWRLTLLGSRDWRTIK